LINNPNTKRVHWFFFCSQQATIRAKPKVIPINASQGKESNDLTQKTPTQAVNSKEKISSLREDNSDFI
jgi:hypothetical protein